MARCGLRNEYDRLILAGAGLGAVSEKFLAWNRTSHEHPDAVELRLMALDGGVETISP
jgi:hypothetical protein